MARKCAVIVYNETGRLCTEIVPLTWSDHGQHTPGRRRRHQGICQGYVHLCQRRDQDCFCAGHGADREGDVVGEGREGRPGVAHRCFEASAGGRPWGIALSADGTHLFTANGTSSDLSILDVVTGNVDRDKRKDVLID